MLKSISYPVPKEALDNDRLSFVGMSGSGKTYAASGAVERLLEYRARVIAIDPLGVWYGLRLQRDGRSSSAFDVPIFGGPRGDLALTEHAGAVIGETVAGMAQSCIVDLSQIGTRAGERRFMLAFLQALYRGINGAQVHVIFDEADMWAPQRLLDKDGEAAKLLGMMETIVRRGRVRGFVPWLITQRPAVLSKDVLSQSDGIVSFKLTASQDRDAIGAWIEGQADRQDGKVILGSLPSLERGSGVVWIPSRGVLETVAFPLKVTFDSSRAPKRGETRPDAVLKPLDLGELRERLATVEAETKANDPKTLKAEIAALKRQLAKSSATDPKDVEEAYQRGWREGQRNIADVHVRALRRWQVDLTERAAAIAASAEALEALSDEPAPKGHPSRPIAPVPRAALVRPVSGCDLPSAPGIGVLTGPQRRVMASLAFWLAVGEGRPTRAQVAAVAGYRPGSGNFNNIVGALSSSSHAWVPEPGRLALAVSFEAPSGAEARKQLLSVFDGPQMRLVEAASARTGDMTRDELAAAAGYAPGSGNFNNIAGSLTTMDVLRRTGTGRIGMSDWARRVIWFMVTISDDDMSADDLRCVILDGLGYPLHIDDVENDDHLSIVDIPEPDEGKK